MTTESKQHLSSTLEQLSPENQQHVLDFADTLLAAQGNPAVTTWLKLAAMFPPADLADMQRAINQLHERDGAHAE